MIKKKELVLQSLEIPSVPAVAIKVMRIIDDPYASIDEIQRVIVSDQSLTANVLNLANSAYYNVGHKIDTISEAISLMGLDTIRILTLAISTQGVYKNFGLIEQKLWEHGIGVSIASGVIARDCRNIKREEAIVAGLLHDIGKTIMNYNFPERFRILTQRVYDKRVRYSSIEKEHFNFTHAEVGAYFAEEWAFPRILIDVIRNHHNCDSHFLESDSYTGTLCLVVALADALCIRLGVGYRGPMADLDLGIDEMMKKLGISEKRFLEIIDIFKEAYVEEKAFYKV